MAGRLYPVSGRQHRSKPVIHLDDPRQQYLSFINLVEAHVLAAIRRRHGVKPPKSVELWITFVASSKSSVRSLTRHFKRMAWTFLSSATAR